MSSGELKLSSKQTVPPALQNLLVREAAFTVSRKRIGEAVTVAQQARDTLSAARPLLSFVRQDAKKEHRAKLREAEENVEVLEAGARKLDATIPVLTLCVERSVENYLREMDPEYVIGLSASRFSTDWKRILDRYEQAAELYMAALEQLPSILERLVPNEVCGAHFDGRQLIEDTAKRATAVLREIHFINKISEAQRLRVGSTGVSLEKQPARNWPEVARSLLAVQPLAAARTVKALFAESKEVVEQVRAAIRNEGRLATYAGGYGVTSYHESVWTTLRELFTAKLNSDQLEQILEDTEKRIETGTLEEFAPEPVEFPASAISSVAVSGLRVASTYTPSGAATSTPVSSTPAATPAVNGKGYSLKLPGRPAVVISRPNQTLSQPQLSPQPPTPLATPSQTAAQTSLSKDALEAKILAELKAEKERMNAMMSEAQASLSEREQFLSQSEAKLMETTQAQLEREVELEQREEELRELERRLRELQPNLLPPTPEKKKKEFDEFNE